MYMYINLMKTFQVYSYVIHVEFSFHDVHSVELHAEQALLSKLLGMGDEDSRPFQIVNAGVLLFCSY